ncbi:MAG: galactose mutarotase [Oscillospiraceae bacterium]|jgi:aldose 1-epimerase|nr:galactose mutarotase [Oscillospiraceae bacterium]
MDIVKKPFGKTSDGKSVDLFILSNADIQIGILSLGGIINFLKVPDKNGHPVDIVLGYDTVEEYERNSGHFGAIIGRCANRIAKGRFVLGGREYNLYCNNNGNHLHGGRIGFDSMVWQPQVSNDKLILSLTSPDGQEGYPGTLNVSVTHSLSDDGVFTWDCCAKSDKDTLCNLTNHTYFNLSGHNSGSVLNQMLQIESDAFTESDSELIPTGSILPVDGTPMDFRTAHAIGERINSDYTALNLAGGYDHNYAIRGKTGTLRKAAFAYDTQSGISISLSTTLPGVQFYTGNFITEVGGKENAVYRKNSGFCLETQFFPDAINHPNFEQPILKAGDTYRHTTSLKFGSEK